MIAIDAINKAKMQKGFLLGLGLSGTWGGGSTEVDEGGCCNDGGSVGISLFVDGG